MSDDFGDSSVLGITCKIVVKYVSHNSVPFADLPDLIQSVHAAFKGAADPPAELPPPFVPIKRSVTDTHLVCLEDGKTFKTLKRHLQMVHGMTPEQYRNRWGLNPDYPLVAPAYARERSALAKDMGLGRQQAQSAKVVHLPPAKSAPIEPSKPRRRPRQARRQG